MVRAAVCRQWQVQVRAWGEPWIRIRLGENGGGEGCAEVGIG